MLDDIILEIENLKNEKNIKKLKKTNCPHKLYGLRIMDLKAIVKKYKINKNNELADLLFKTDIYDAMVLACLIIDVKTADREILINWCQQTDYMNLIESRIGYLCAEHFEYNYYLDTFKNINTDKYQTIYYMIIGGRVIMDPNFNPKLINDAINDIKNNILTIDLIHTKSQLNDLVGNIGIQIQSKSEDMKALHFSYKKELEIQLKPHNISLSNPTGFIEMMENSGNIGRTRPMCRC